MLRHVQLCVTPWTVVHQTPLSMGFFRQEYWSGSPCPPPGDFPDPAIEPVSPTSPTLQVVFTTEPPGKALINRGKKINEKKSISSKCSNSHLGEECVVCICVCMCACIGEGMK